MGEHHLVKEMHALVTGHGVYRLEEAHDRALGGVDVIVSYESPGAEKRYAGYRLVSATWRCLDGAWSTLVAARREVGTATDGNVVRSRALIELLDLALRCVR